MSDGPKTPIHSTSSYPIYRQAAEELLEKLAPIQDPETYERAQRARQFIDTFQAWTPRNRPSDEERFKIISEFLEFHRKTLDFVAAQRKPKK